MNHQDKVTRSSFVLTVVVWAAIWGIFEATVGYWLHAISFGFSWMVWYPVACFCIGNVYRKTRRISAICLVGAICAAIKMLNLFLPGRIDKVINPAISIVFEALAIAAVALAVTRLSQERSKTPVIRAASVLAMNMGWRLLFVLYLLFLVPAWMREISIISSTEKFIPFFITQNLATTAFVFTGYQLKDYFLKPVVALEGQLARLTNALPSRARLVMQTSTAAVMLFADISLQLLLK